MPRTIEAIYEEGVLKPITPLDISEHKKVTLILADEPEAAPDLLMLASMVYNGLTPEDITDIEKLSLDRSRFSRD